MDEEYKEIELNGVKLRVFRNGTIMRYITRFINKIGWNLCNPTPNTGGYYYIQLKNKIYIIHRIIAMVYLGLDITNTCLKVDHIDRCKTNNNVDNLRIVTPQENTYNTNAKGYSWNKHDKRWKVHINVNKQRLYLGGFKNEEDARNTYLEAKEKYHVINPHPPQL